MCGKTVRCPACEACCEADANFCRSCGAKIRGVCDCWIMKEPYNCGQSKCPGYRLFQRVTRVLDS